MYKSTAKPFQDLPNEEWRDVRGKRVWCSKLNENDVREILKSIKTQAELAIVYKVSQHAIWSIRSGKTWNHVTGLPLNRINKSSL